MNHWFHILTTINYASCLIYSLILWGIFRMCEIFYAKKKQLK